MPEEAMERASIVDIEVVARRAVENAIRAIRGIEIEFEAGRCNYVNDAVAEFLASRRRADS